MASGTANNHSGKQNCVDPTGRCFDLIVVNPRPGSTASSRSKLRKRDQDMRISRESSKEVIQDEPKRWELSRHDTSTPVSSRDVAKNTADRPRGKAREKYDSMEKGRNTLPTPPPTPYPPRLSTPELSDTECDDFCACCGNSEMKREIDNKGKADMNDSPQK
jgi:hypothetical protein